MATFSLTVTSGDVAATLTDYPAYVDLSEMPASFWSEVTNGGGDIRVYSDAGLSTELAREVVTCATATDTGEMHTKVSSLTTSTVIYITVDGASTEPSAGSTYGSEAVWTDYNAVYHMGDATTSSVSDSTASAFTGTKASANNPVETTSGQIGDAQVFTRDYISTSEQVVPNTSFTISTWVDVPSSATISNGENHTLFLQGGGAGGELAWYTFTSFGGATNQQRVFAGNGQVALGSDLRGDGQTYLTLVFTGSAYTLYENGVSVDTNSGVALGRTNFFIGSNISARELTATIDETRIRNSNVNANWITTEYNNQSDVAGFWTIAEFVPGTFTPSPMMHLLQMM